MSFTLFKPIGLASSKRQEHLKVVQQYKFGSFPSEEGRHSDLLTCALQKTYYPS